MAAALEADDVLRLREMLANLQPYPAETVEQLCIRGLAVQREFLTTIYDEQLPFLEWPRLIEDQRRAWTEWAVHKLAAEAEYNSWLAGPRICPEEHTECRHGCQPGKCNERGKRNFLRVLRLKPSE